MSLWYWLLSMFIDHDLFDFRAGNFHFSSRMAKREEMKQSKKKHECNIGRRCRCAFSVGPWNATNLFFIPFIIIIVILWSTELYMLIWILNIEMYSFILSPFFISACIFCHLTDKAVQTHSFWIGTAKYAFCNDRTHINLPVVLIIGQIKCACKTIGVNKHFLLSILLAPACFLAVDQMVDERGKWRK